MLYIYFLSTLIIEKCNLNFSSIILQLNFVNMMLKQQQGKSAELTDSCTQCNFEEPPSDTELGEIEDDLFLEMSDSYDLIE